MDSSVVSGRGALLGRRSRRVTNCGVLTSENADMSSDKTGEIPVRRKPKVSWGRFVLPGLVGT
jgi:hypothetical protein